MKKYRILSLDGGGTWALIQAMALKEIYGNVEGHHLMSKFDMIVANSGGSIVLGAMAVNKRLSEIERMFMDRNMREDIFRTSRSLARPTPIGPRYSADGKLRGLKGQLGPKAEAPLNHVVRDIAESRGHCAAIVITAFDYDRQRATFFRSDSDSRAGSCSTHAIASLVHAVHASTNAPAVFFDRPAVFDGRRYWDGAVAGYNNPVVAGVVEASAALREDNRIRERIEVLSIGTGSVFLPLEDKSRGILPPLAKRRDRPSPLGDIRKMATSVLDDPPDVASFIAHMMLSQPLPRHCDDVVRSGCIIRMNPLVQPIWDDHRQRYVVPQGLRAEEFRKLTELRMDAIHPKDVDLIKKLAQRWMASQDSRGVLNQGIRTRRDDAFSVEIGHRLFPEACSEWRKRAGIQ